MKKILLWSLGIVSALAITLVVHVVLVSDKQPTHLVNIQLARIDFDAPLEPEVASRLRTAVTAMDGVMHCYVNADQGTLVYGYELGQQTADAVYRRVVAVSDVPCEPFVVAESDLAGSCPAMARSGAMAHLTRWIHNLSN